MPIALIAALDRNFAIGRDNALPWHLPEDLKRFKRLTLGHAVLMGRKTAQSIGRALPGRVNLVLTRSGAAPYPQQLAVGSLAQAKALIAEQMLFVIGGGEVYRESLAHADQMFLTWVDTEVAAADSHFPRFDLSHWHEVARSAYEADARHGHGYMFVDYVRRRGGLSMP